MKKRPVMNVPINLLNKNVIKKNVVQQRSLKRNIMFRDRDVPIFANRLS